MGHDSIQAGAWAANGDRRDRRTVAVLLLALPALGMGPIFSPWSPSICCFSNLFVHMKGDEAQSSRAANSALITVMSYLSRRHEPQCCPVLQQTQSGVTPTPLSAAHHRDLYSRHVGFDIYSLKANSYDSTGLMKEGKKNPYQRGCENWAAAFVQRCHTQLFLACHGIVAFVKGNNAAIISVLI